MVIITRIAQIISVEGILSLIIKSKLFNMVYTYMFLTVYVLEFLPFQDDKLLNLPFMKWSNRQPSLPQVAVY